MHVKAETTLGELAKVGAQLLKLSLPQHRDRQMELGFDLTAQSVGMRTSRRGIMLT
jgi:hypothetical protein